MFDSAKLSILLLVIWNNIPLLSFFIKSPIFLYNNLTYWVVAFVIASYAGYLATKKSKLDIANACLVGIIVMNISWISGLVLTYLLSWSIYGSTGQQVYIIIMGLKELATLALVRYSIAGFGCGLIGGKIGQETK